MANNHLAGYRNVLAAARRLNPKQIVGVYPDGETRPLTNNQ